MFAYHFNRCRSLLAIDDFLALILIILIRNLIYTDRLIFSWLIFQYSHYEPIVFDILSVVVNPIFFDRSYSNFPIDFNLILLKLVFIIAIVAK